MRRISDVYSHKMALTHIGTIAILILSLLSDITLELIVISLSKINPKLTLLEHICSSLTLTTLLSIIFLGSIFCFLCIGILITSTSTHGPFIIYIIFLKFFELIPPLIDLINLLLIYQHRLNNSQNQNSSFQIYLSSFIALIRLIINIDVIRRKCNCRWKRKFIVLFDFLIFILINVTLLRYSTKNLLRIGRKIILPILIYKLNDLFYNKTFWIDLIRCNKYTKRQFNATIIMKLTYEYFSFIIIHLVLFMPWIISSFIIYLFFFYSIPLLNIIGDGNLFFILYKHIFHKSYGIIIMMCISIISLLFWDILECRNTLLQNGISHFCTGTDLLSITNSTNIFLQSQISTETIVEDNIR